MSNQVIFCCKPTSKFSTFYLIKYCLKLSDDQWLNEDVRSATFIKHQMQGMQRQNTLGSYPKCNHSECPLEIALRKPDDEELFYSASLHFLKKRLHEKTHTSKPREFTQSCCSLSRASESSAQPFTRNKVEASNSGISPQTTVESSLSMHQVLPFPKSNKEGFFNRMKNTFRKYRQSFSMSEANSSEELEISKSISNFKFPRCQRFSTARSSSLVQIAEEKSDEFLSSKTTDWSSSNCKSNVLDNTIRIGR